MVVHLQYILYYTVPILDFWGPYAKLCRRRGLGWKNGWNAFVHISLHLESRSRKALEKHYLFRGSGFFFFFCLMQETVQRSRYMIWLTFYVDYVRAHWI